jgi:hypothetical protein
VNEMMSIIETRHAIAWRLYSDDMFSTLRLYDERTGHSPNEQHRTLLSASKTLTDYFSYFVFVFVSFFFHLFIVPFFDLHPTPKGEGIIN